MAVSARRGDRNPSKGRNVSSIRRVRWVLLLALLPACTRHEASPHSRGKRVAEGAVLSLRASADGAYLAFLHHCQPVKDRTLPPGTSSCDLAVAPSGGGAARRVAGRVTTLPQGHAWSASGHVLAALADYDHVEGLGQLVLWSGAEPHRVSDVVSFYALDRAGGQVGWVSEGQLYVGRVESFAPVAVAGAERVATFEFGGSEPAVLLARRSARAGGVLLAVRDHVAVAVAADVRDYGFARDGRRFAFTAGTSQSLSVASAAGFHPAPPLGREVRAFLFSPRDDAIAFVADAVPGRQGDLYLAAPGGAPGRVAQRVGDLRWSSDGSRLAWLQDYDPRSRTGTLALGGLGVPSAVVSRNVSDFDLTSDGSSVAFLVHETAGGYSVNLGLSQATGSGAPSTVARGVFGFSFSPDSRWLYYRAACVREAESCDLLRVPASGPAPDGRAELVAQGVKSFEFAPGRPDRLLVSWARKDRVALDLAFWEGGKLTAIDTYALPGSVQFLGGAPGRIAYAVVQTKRAGAYVAEVP
jgi:dipeptidyl aminopeptidase/acylaminoacyl peptidase